MSFFFIVALLLFGLSLMGFYFAMRTGRAVIVGAVLFMLMAMGWAYEVYNFQLMIEVGFCALFLTILLWYLATKGLFGNGSKEAIHTAILLVNIGDKGSAITTLRPTGTIRVQGKEFMARCDSITIPANYSIEVIGFEDDLILVKPKDFS